MIPVVGRMQKDCQKINMFLFKFPAWNQALAETMRK